jgi:glucose/arabinose dehydrogenase
LTTANGALADDARRAGAHSPPPTKSIEVIASDLTTPWGIDTGPYGSVFVAENATGNIVKIWNGAQRTMATTQPDLDDVAFDGGWAVSYAIGAPPEDAEADLLGRAFVDGSLADERPIGADEEDDAPDDAATYGIDESTFAEGCEVPDEIAAYTDDVELDGEGHGLLALEDGRRYVADEADGRILSVGQAGEVSVVAELQPVTRTLAAQLDTADGPVPVPACLQGATFTGAVAPRSVVEGPDGWLYVGAQAGSEDVDGSGVVLRVNPWTGESSVWQDSLTTVSDIAFDPQGRLFVAEAFGGDTVEADDAEDAPDTAGALKRIDTTWVDGGLAAAGVTTIATGADGVVTPMGVATDEAGAVYVTVNGASEEVDAEPVANGQVLKLSGF